MNVYKTQAQIESGAPCPCGAENWRTSKLYCADCRNTVQPTAVDEMKRLTELRAIMNVIALNRADRRADALHDHEVLTRRYEELQEVAV